MKIRYLSDLHLEFINPTKINDFIKQIPPGPNEICILAGDIGNPYKPHYKQFMTFINNNFKKTFYITGNHEYYNDLNTIEGTDIFLTLFFKKFDNIHFLNNNYVIYENYCFIGTTLWSNITDPSYTINDVKHIPQFNYIKCNELNLQCIQILEDIIQNNKNCIVITHHLPSYLLINDKYKTTKMMPYNQWFYCNLDFIFIKYARHIKCWFYGHTHTPSIQTINNIQFLCNNENDIYDFDKSILLN
jgi:predicted phosphodiesterase